MLTNFAWGVVDLRDNTFTEVDPEIGAFRAVSRMRDEDNFIPKYTDLSSHPCTKQELGAWTFSLFELAELNDAEKDELENSKFYKP